MATMAAVLVRPTRDRRPDLLNRIREEFLEMPGLALTLAQAQRLWHVEPATCRLLLDVLVAEGYLWPCRDGRYRRRTRV